MSFPTVRALSLVAAVTTLAAPHAASAAQASTGQKIDIVTPYGTIVAVLDAKHAPVTVKNFLHYVDTKFYDGGTFFRALPGFVIQGGNKAKESESDPKIVLEDPKTTGLRNVDGALAMARTSDPNSATTEFFVDDGRQTSLDAAPGQPGYAVFGHVVSGMSIVRKISHLPTKDEMLSIPIPIVRIVRAK